MVMGDTLERCRCPFIACQALRLPAIRTEDIHTFPSAGRERLGDEVVQGGRLPQAGFQGACAHAGFHDCGGQPAVRPEIARQSERQGGFADAAAVVRNHDDVWGHVANPAPQPPGEQRLPQIILGVTQKLVGKQNHCAAFPGGIDRRRHDGKRDAPTFKDVMRVEQDQEGIGVQH